jgi:hypothetical protein
MPIAPVGKIASLRGSWNGTMLTAYQVQIGEDNED